MSMKQFHLGRDIPGTLLETIGPDSKIIPDKFVSLRKECGIREFANIGMIKQLDVEVLKRVLEKGMRSEPGLFIEIERALILIGKEALDELERRVKTFGTIRLENFLGLKKVENAGSKINEVIEGDTNQK